MRLYASSDCNQLANAVPAALATGGQILVSVWTEDDKHFNAEKQALLQAVQTWEFGWIVAACDWVRMDGYPYYQGMYANGIENSFDLFWGSVYQVRDVVNRVHPGVWVWVTETVWPSAGASVNAAVPSVQNARMYWSQTICSSFAHRHTFVYSLQDGGNLPFGVVGANFNPAYNPAC
ncbi:related to glucan 1,3-beta-glucosidase precursor [Phialocephala subalpina]|uniref:Probable glucan endo-1,3-beta-glucosidase eglC n=1 Tax=Phialocephala subalpina TaxID=576137 RepID=A0A1L7X014_9HELO|nr:related to glucan 1,3-beta-glucosidase precursor [Phialocephala subalpina]